MWWSKECWKVLGNISWYIFCQNRNYHLSVIIDKEGRYGTEINCLYFCLFLKIVCRPTVISYISQIVYKIYKTDVISKALFVKIKCKFPGTKNVYKHSRGCFKETRIWGWQYWSLRHRFLLYKTKWPDYVNACLDRALRVCNCSVAFTNL